MEEIKETQPLPSPMEQLSRQQLRYAKLQCLFSLITACLFAVILIVILCYVPRVNGILSQADTILDNAEQVTSQLAQADIEGVMADLKNVSRQMANSNLDGIAQDISALLQTTQESVEDAMSKLNGVDLEALNQAISDLSAIMKPLSSFFGKIK